MSDGRTAGAPGRGEAVELARAFASARYHADLGGAPVELRVGCAAADIERRLPAAAYAFITAWNPDAGQQPGVENAKDDDALAARLEALGVDYRRTWAEDAQGGHREAGWLVAGLDAHRADELGRAFDQAGILHWHAGEPVRLHMLMPRPPGPDAELPHVDWIE